VQALAKLVYEDKGAKSTEQQNERGAHITHYMISGDRKIKTAYEPPYNIS